MLKNPFRWVRENIYFAVGRDRFTDDSKDNVVQLRDKIVALVEDRITEIIGSTASDESYVLLDGPKKERYALARVYKEKIIEYTYFQPGWPKDQYIPCSASIPPRPLVIKGDPFRIAREKDQHSQFILKVESQTDYGSELGGLCISVWRADFWSAPTCRRFSLIPKR